MAHGLAESPLIDGDLPIARLAARQQPWWH